MGWNTDTEDFAKAVAEFEEKLPGFWWSVGQCSLGAHASCAIDGKGSQAHLLVGVKAGDDPFDSGFHCDTIGGSPAEALRDVMHQALADPRLLPPPTENPDRAKALEELASLDADLIKDG